jgi:hypothetical protein
MSAPRLDAANIAGITTLMNQQNIKQGIDLEKIEKDVMGKKEDKYKKSGGEHDPVKLYTQELNQLAEDLGIELLDDDIQMNKSGPIGGDNISNMIKPIKIDNFDKKSSKHNKPSKHKSRSSRSSSASSSSRLSSSSISSGTSGSESSYTGSSYTGSSYTGSSYSESGSYSGSESGSESGSGSYSESGSESGSHTDSSASSRSRSRSKKHKHKKEKFTYLEPISEDRRHINTVVSHIRADTHTAVGEEKERIRDNKASKLEQIGQLRMALEDEGIDCTSVTKPNIDSPLDEIDGVLNILRLKNDRNRYSTIAEEIILGVAEGIETVFNGTRRIPILGWRPDYTGYHNTVNVKLHRMRFETSQVVGSIIERRKISPTARIALELLPSFLLYPRQQKMQKNTQSLYDGYSGGGGKISDARGAYNSIRAADEKKSLYDALDV